MHHAVQQILSLLPHLISPAILYGGRPIHPAEPRVANIVVRDVGELGLAPVTLLRIAARAPEANVPVGLALVVGARGAVLPLVAVVRRVTPRRPAEEMVRVGCAHLRYRCGGGEDEGGDRCGGWDALEPSARRSGERRAAAAACRRPERRRRSAGPSPPSSSFSSKLEGHHNMCTHKMSISAARPPQGYFRQHLIAALESTRTGGHLYRALGVSR